MPSRPLEPGDPLRLGRFELLGRLGEGGQGVVYLGRGTGPGEERVAVKVLRSSADALVLERLARELAAVHQVQPFVTAGVIEATTDGDRRYVVTEFIDGPTLAERVETGGPLPEGELLRLAVGTATALTAIHGAGVVHRDFKPGNVLLGPDGPRVVDFGIARLTDVTTITHGVIGTPAYMTPEQVAGERPTSAVDIFAWAVTMIYAATGRTAFQADTAIAMMYRVVNSEPDLTGVPPSLAPLLRQCLVKDPLQRPTARDVLLSIVDPASQRSAATRAFQPLADDRSAVAVTGPQPVAYADPEATHPTALGVDTAPRRVRRGPIVAAVGAAAVAALIVIGVMLLLKNHSLTASNAGSSHSGTPAASTPAASTPAASGTSSPPASVVASGPKIPASFAGNWSGTAMQSMVGDSQIQLPNSITLTLAAGGRTAHENNDSCVNTLTLTKVTATTLTFSEPDVTGTCVGGVVTLAHKGNKLAYRWTNGTEQNAGNLSRTKTTSA